MANTGNTYGGGAKHSYQLPDINVPDSEKKEEWHKQYVQSIVHRSLNGSYDLSSNAMNEAYNFYLGTQNDQSFEFLRTAEDGDSLPAQWINYNKIKVKIDLLLGEISKKGYEVIVKSINRDAKMRKLDMKEDSRVDMRMQGLASQLGEGGLPLEQEGFLAKDEAELDEYYNYDYKEKAEIIMHFMLKGILTASHWDYQRIALFRDLLIAGRCFIKNEVVNGMPKTRRIDPRFMIFDTACQDDFLTDATYFGEIRYMNMAECASQYGLTRKELQEAYGAWQEYNQNIGSGTNYARGGRIGNFSNEFGIARGSSLGLFRNQGGELRVLVTSATWCDYKDMTYKKSKDSYGNEHIKKVSTSVQDNDNIKKINIKIWRQGTLIGGKFLKGWGEVKNQNRDVDNFATTDCPYRGLIPNFINGASVSKVDQLKGLQSLKDVTMFNIQLAMARAGAKGFVYDVSQVPDEWDIHNVIKYLKTTGIAFIDSRKDGLPSNFNQFSPIDMTLSASVAQYLDISRMIDAEMDSISGINEARQGQISSANQAVGVTQSSLFQSNLATETFFQFFAQFAGGVFTHLAGLGKIAWADKDRFAGIVGDSGINFLKEDVDLDLNDYGVKISEIPAILDDMQSFQGMVQAALQSGQVDFISAVKLMREKDIVQGVLRLERDIEKQQEKQQQAQQAEMQAQQQMAQQQNEAEMQKEQAKAEADAQTKLAVEQAKGQNKQKEEVIKGKFDMAGNKMDFSKAYVIEKIKAQNAKRKESMETKKKK
jgi:hypothetical protein